MIDLCLTSPRTTLNSLQSFLKEDAGAVTVDWVFITAACVGLATVVATSVGAGTVSAAESIESGLERGATLFCEDGAQDGLCD